MGTMAAVCVERDRTLVAASTSEGYSSVSWRALHRASVFFLVVVFLTQSNSSSTWNMTTRGLWDIKGNWAVVGCILHLVRAMTGSLTMPGTMLDCLWKSQPTKRDTRGWRARGSWDCQWHNPKQWQSQLIAANSGDREHYSDTESDADDTETDGDSNTETKPGRDRCNSPVGVSCVSSLPQYQTAVGSSNYSLLCAQ